MAKISACVISYNEQDKIVDCLRSLADVVDEIVVVDSESTDETRDVARGLGARVVVQPFLGHVAQKNFAVAQCEHDWILSLDCDERLSAELRASILGERDQLGRAPGYEVSRRTYHVDRWIDHAWYPDRRIRLFDRRRARWGGTDPHDSVQVESGGVRRLAGDILHYSYDSLSDHLKTIDRYSEIAARRFFEQGRRVSAVTPLLRGMSAFARSYVTKRGFLDGFGGLVVSVMSATETFAKYAKLRYLQTAAAEQEADRTDTSD